MGLTSESTLIEQYRATNLFYLVKAFLSALFGCVMYVLAFCVVVLSLFIFLLLWMVTTGKMRKKYKALTRHIVSIEG